MKLLVKLLVLGIAIGIIYYLIFELHLLDVIIHNVFNLFKTIMGYAINAFENMITDLI